MKLADRVAVITAAGSGMGRAAAVLFAQEGAQVVVVDLDEAAAQSTCDEITGAGGRAWPFQCDVADVDRLRALFDEVESRHGVLHVLYNHAGTPGANGIDITEDEWTFAIDVNMKSAFFGTMLALPLLRKSEGKGSIIYTSSVSGVVGSPRAPLYSMAKGGVVLLMRSVALMLAPEGIRANAICPGPVDTPMLPVFLGGIPGPEGAKMMMAAVPLGRAATPQEIATAALFLACDDSSFITGVPLPLDGGYTAR
jgi:NAD(P)-dependent dehydrogenase (short-subunit alcohol dehydrogenase family)